MNVNIKLAALKTVKQQQDYSRGWDSAAQLSGAEHWQAQAHRKKLGTLIV